MHSMHRVISVKAMLQVVKRTQCLHVLYVSCVHTSFCRPGAKGDETAQDKDVHVVLIPLGDNAECNS